MFNPIQALVTRALGIGGKIPRPYGKMFMSFNVSVLSCVIYLSFGTAVLAGSDQLRILAFGDSLTAGYGLSQSDAFPTRLAAKLEAAGISAEIVNAGVSGDTTTGALQRLDWLMDRPFQLAIVELGANDALRAVDPDLTRRNLEQIVAKLKSAGITVLLAGMKAPRNLGPEFAQSFDSIFPEVAANHGLNFYPFFLEGVASNPAYNQQDGMHPNAKGVAIIVDRMLPFVIQALGKDIK